MRAKSVAVALSVAGLSLAGALGAALSAHQLKREGRWLLERSAAQAQAYAASFDGAAADRQLELFSERRAVLERAHAWHQLEALLILAAVLAAAVAYGAYLLRMARREAEEALGSSSSTPQATGSPGSSR